MNVDTGELRRFMEGEEIPEGFTEVPDKQKMLAEALLGDEDSVYVPKNNHLRKSMTAEQVKKKRKMAKKSRSKNRGK